MHFKDEDGEEGEEGESSDLFKTVQERIRAEQFCLLLLPLAGAYLNLTNSGTRSGCWVSSSSHFCFFLSSFPSPSRAQLLLQNDVRLHSWSTVLS